MDNRKAALGGIILVGTRIFSRVLDMFAMIIMARILTPADFGLVTLAMSVVIIAEAVLELPLTQALLRMTNIHRNHYDSAFTIAILRAFLLYVCIFLLSFPFSKIYSDERLAFLLRILGFAPVIKGIASPMLVEFQRLMSFWRDALAETMSKFFGALASVSFAILGAGYWSVAAGLICANIAYTVCSFVLAPYKPRLCFLEFTLFAKFSGWISMAQIAIAVNWQIENLLMGRYGSSTQLGLFKVGSDLANVPFQALFVPLARPLISIFSKLDDFGSLVRDRYQLISSYLVSIGLPIMVGISATSPYITHAILGKQWDSAAPILSLLAASTIPAIFTVAAYPFVMSAGQTKIIFQQNFIDLLIRLPLVIMGITLFGVYGVVGARILAELFRNIYIMKTINYLIGIPIYQQVSKHYRYICGAVVMYFMVLSSTNLINTCISDDFPFVRLLISSTLGVIVYISLIFAIWSMTGRYPGPERSVLNFLKDRIKGRLDRNTDARPNTNDKAKDYT